MRLLKTVVQRRDHRIENLKSFITFILLGAVVFFLGLLAVVSSSSTAKARPRELSDRQHNSSGERNSGQENEHSGLDPGHQETRASAASKTGGNNSGEGSESENDSRRVTVECPAPSYPQDAVYTRWEGVVRFQLDFTEGRVSNVQLTRSSGYSVLDNAATRAVWTCRLRPAVSRSGVAIDINYTVLEESDAEREILRRRE